MAISTEAMDAIEALLTGADPLSLRLSTLRAGYPHLSFTRCDRRDVAADAVPYVESDEVALFLVDRSSHCWTLTSDPAVATGLLIATT